MRQTLLTSSLVLCLLAIGCNRAEDTKGFNTYGGKAEVKKPLTMGDVFARGDSLKDQRVCVKGEIKEVCKNRGCWMTVTDGRNTARVRFTKSESCSEGFVVPRNAAGRRVYLNGTVEVRTLTEDDARHYAMDNGKSEAEIDAIKGPQKEVTIFADAVMIADGATLEAPVQ